MKRFVVLSLVIFLVAGCRQEEKKQPVQPVVDHAAAHRKAITEWQERRAKRLQAEDGWLTLVALNWLKEGENEIKIPTVPQSPGKITLKNGEATLEPASSMTIEGKPVAGPTKLLNDAEPTGPTVVQMGGVRFQVIKRGPRYGLRVKDANAETRTHFQGLEYFPIDPKWRVEAKFEAYNPMKKIPIDDVTGMTADNDSPGALVFTVDGKEYRIDPVLEEGSDELFIIFRDATSRDATYGAGRYLYAAKPGPDGKVIVDFNKAYNPPCAFTPYATCPLPPEQNRLPFPIEAGEKKYAGGHA